MVQPEERIATSLTNDRTDKPNSAAQFVAKFAGHYQTCVSLAKRFAGDDLKDSAALAHFCRASQEMLEQAKEAGTLTQIYLALDEKHRDTVRPMITSRFKDIAKLARSSMLRLCDSITMAQNPTADIKSAQRDFQLHAEKFQEALRGFIAMSAETG